MTHPLLPLLAAFALFAISTAAGMPAVVKLIRMHEARHELRHGSASALRALGGWALITFWLMTTWFLSTILGDWYISGDLQGAVDRSYLRLRILLELAAAFGDSS